MHRTPSTIVQRSIGHQLGRESVESPEVVDPIQRWRNGERLMKPEEIAKLFDVCGNTVWRWLNDGKFGEIGRDFIKTPGNHSRVWETKVREIFACQTEDRKDSEES